MAASALASSLALSLRAGRALTSLPRRLRMYSARPRASWDVPRRAPPPRPSVTRAAAGSGGGKAAEGPAGGGFAKNKKWDWMDDLVDAIKMGGPDGRDISYDLEGLPPMDNRACNKVITKLSRARYWVSAEKVFAFMKENGTEEVNAFTYCSMVAAYGKARQYTRAQSAFDEMQGAGLEPDVITYNALINAAETAGAWKGAIAAYEDMQKAGLPPNAVTFTALISVLEKNKQWNRAVEISGAMKDAGFEPVGGRDHGVR